MAVEAADTVEAVVVVAAATAVVVAAAAIVVVTAAAAAVAATAAATVVAIATSLPATVREFSSRAAIVRTVAVLCTFALTFLRDCRAVVFCAIRPIMTTGFWRTSRTLNGMEAEPL